MNDTVSNKKIVSLSEWKRKRSFISETRGLNNYLKILSFHELVLESHSIIEEVKNRPLDHNLTE